MAVSSQNLEGYLSKKKTRTNQWDTRYFRLQDFKLAWYENHHTSETKNFLSLKLVRKVTRETFKKTPHAHQASCGIKIEHHDGTYYLVADNTEDADEWVAKLSKALEHGRQTGWNLANYAESISLGGGGHSSSEEDPPPPTRHSLASSPHRQMPGSSPGNSSTHLVSGRPSSVFSPPVVVNDEPATTSQESEFEHVPGPYDSAPAPTAAPASAPDSPGVLLSNPLQVQGSASPRLSRAHLTLGQGGSGSDVVKVPVHLNDLQFPVRIKRGSTVADLLGKIREHDKLSALSREFLDSLELWEVTGAGRIGRLHEDQTLDTAYASSKSFYIVPQNRRLFVIYSEDGRFVSTVLPSDTTAESVCQAKSDTHRELADLVADVRRPGLFVSGLDRQLEDEERLADLLDTAVDPSSVRFTVRSCMPLFLEPDSANVLEHPTMQGWLQKKGGNNHQWQRRWCVFAGGAVRYFKNPDDTAEKGAIMLREIQSINEIADDMHKQNNVFHIATPGRTYVFSADSAVEQADWVKVLQQSLQSYEQNQSAVKCGYLDKKGHVNPAFKKRWFTLKDNILLYSDTPTSATQEVPLSEYRVVSGDGMIIELVGPKKYTLRADNARDKEDWLAALQGSESDMPVATEIIRVKTTRPPAAPSALSSSPRSGPARYDGTDQSAPLGSWASGHNDPIISSDFQRVKAVPRSRGSSHSTSSQSQQQSQQQQQRGYADTGSYGYGGGGGGGYMAPPAVRPLTQQALPPPLFAQGSGSFADIPDVTGVTLPDHLQPQNDGLSAFEKSVPFPLGVSSSSSSSAASIKANLQRRSQTVSAHPPSTTTSTAAAATATARPPPSLLNLPPTARFAGPVDVPTPATLRTLMLTPDKSELGPSATVLRVRLSGVALQMHAGRWSLSEGQAFHAVLPDQSDRVETIPLPPSIVAIFDHGQRRWFVVPAAALQPTRTATVSTSNPAQRAMGGSEGQYAQDMPDENEPRDPAMVAFVRAGGKRVAVELVRACETLMTYHSESTQRSGTLSNTDVMDDSLFPTVGHLVRGPFCSAVAMMIAHGMVPFRFGGLVRNTLWTVVSEACPTPRPSTSPAGQAAYRVVTDINSFQAMSGDANMKFRTFVCAALNHRFLEDWLRELVSNVPLLQKFYTPHAFLRLCPQAKFEELMLALQPLSMLPFRLYSAFELGNRPDLRRGPSYADPSTPRSAIPRSTSVSIARSGSLSSRAPSHHQQQQHQHQHQHQHQQQQQSYGRAPHMSNSGMLQGVPAEWAPDAAPSGPFPSEAGSGVFQEGMLVRALFDNNTEDPDELLFRAEDILQVQKVVSAEWLICSLLEEQGLVPTSFVGPLESTI